MKRWALILVACIISLSLVAPAAAATPEVQVLIGGAKVNFDQPPVIKAGSTLVPLRAIAEALGFAVSFDSATGTITLTREGTEIVLVLGSNQARVNGQASTLQVPAQSINGRTLVPVRFIAENLGAEVTWDAGTNTVRITPRGQSAGGHQGHSGTDAGQASAEAQALLNKMQQAQMAGNIKARGRMEMALKVVDPSDEELPPEGMTLNLTADVDFHVVDNQLLMNMTMNMPQELGGTMEMGMAIKDGGLYQRTGGADSEWTFISEVPAEAMGDLSQLGVQGLSEFQQMMQNLNAATQVRVVGTESVDGVPTTVLEVVIPGEKLSDALLGSLDLLGSGGMPDVDMTMGDLKANLWVTAEGIPVRVQEWINMTMNMGDPESNQNATMTMDATIDLHMTQTDEPISWPALPARP